MCKTFYLYRCLWNSLMSSWMLRSSDYFSFASNWSLKILVSCLLDWNSWNWPAFSVQAYAFLVYLARVQSFWGYHFKLSTCVSYSHWFHSIPLKEPLGYDLQNLWTFPWAVLNSPSSVSLKITLRFRIDVLQMLFFPCDSYCTFCVTEAYLVSLCL